LQLSKSEAQLSLEHASATLKQLVSDNAALLASSEAHDIYKE
jgi:hypothetical protein